MPRHARSFADPVGSLRSLRGGLDESYALAQGAEANSLPLRSLTGAEQFRARVTVKAHALDADDERLLLAVLGLDGAATRLNRHTRVAETSKVVHGTQSAVAIHEQQDVPYCGPCQRWVDVQARKAQARAQARGSDAPVIRAWARGNGFEIRSGGGRIPRHIRLAYEAAQRAREGGDA